MTKTLSKTASGDTVEALLTDSSPFPPQAIGYDRVSDLRKCIYYVIKWSTKLLIEKRV